MINRPELSLYTAQENSINVKEQALKTGYRPQLGLFAQGAYGNPGLNMLKNSFEPYYIVGARLSWNFGSLYTLKNDKRKFTTERQRIQSNRDLFLFNTHLQLAEQQGVITALQKQMKTDNETSASHHIRKSAEAKVANGTLTVTEMLRELTMKIWPGRTRPCTRFSYSWICITKTSHQLPGVRLKSNNTNKFTNTQVYENSKYDPHGGNRNSLVRL